MVLDLEKEWEDIYSSSSFQHKNEYPSEEVVSFLMRSFGGYADRSKVKVLDLGCGWGNNLRFLEQKKFDYYGIDYSKSAVLHCKKLFRNIEQGYLNSLPYSSIFFDVVIDRRSIQHNSIDILSDIFSEIYRVLNKGGVFFSILSGSDKYDIPVTKLSEKKILELSKNFENIELDYKIETSHNQRFKHKTYTLVAKK